MKRRRPRYVPESRSSSSSKPMPPSSREDPCSDTSLSSNTTSVPDSLLLAKNKEMSFDGDRQSLKAAPMCSESIRVSQVRRTLSTQIQNASSSSNMSVPGSLDRSQPKKKSLECDLQSSKAAPQSLEFIRVSQATPKSSTKVMDFDIAASASMSNDQSNASVGDQPIGVVDAVGGQPAQENSHPSLEYIYTAVRKSSVIAAKIINDHAKPADDVELFNRISQFLFGFM